MIAEANRFKDFIKTDLYPILQTAGSIVEAQQLCEVMKTVMLNKCNAYWLDKTVADLELVSELAGDENAEDVAIYTKVIIAMAELSITDAQKLLQGMGGALDGYTRREAMKKPLSEVDVLEIITV